MVGPYTMSLGLPAGLQRVAARQMRKINARQEEPQAAQTQPAEADGPELQFEDPAEFQDVYFDVRATAPVKPAPLPSAFKVPPPKFAGLAKKQAQVPAPASAVAPTLPTPVQGYTFDFCCVRVITSPWQPKVPTLTGSAEHQKMQQDVFASDNVEDETSHGRTCRCPPHNVLAQKRRIQSR